MLKSNMEPRNHSFVPVELYEEARSLHASGKLAEAAALYRELLGEHPRDLRLLNGLAQVERELGNFEGAAVLYRQSLEIDPMQPEALNGRGVALIYLQRFDEAMASFDRAIALDPGLARAHYNRAYLFSAFNHLDAALANFDRALALSPSTAEWHNDRANVLQRLGRQEEALAGYDRAIGLKPDFVLPYNNRGNVLHELKRLDEALASNDRAVTLNPNYVDAYNNRAVLLRDLSRLDDALAACDRVLALEPGNATAYLNRGVILRDMLRLDDAQAQLAQAVTLQPDFADAHWNLALIKLLAGEFDEGWKLYEWRWKTSETGGRVRAFPQPLWLGGQPLAGKRLLIHAEQGFGDFIQFCRYAMLAQAQGAHLILEVPRALVSLISTLPVDATIVELGQPLPPFDVHCPVMSLPYAFRTTLASIPAPIPYLAADAGKQQEWRQRLGPKTKPRVGLVWSGSATQANNHNRSIPLRLLAPLMQAPVEFHSLQKEIARDDDVSSPELAPLRLHAEELHDFADTAALVQEMDLVISVCTSVAHLAGAMGKPVWVLLPFAADFRWMLNRADSPWYPTATLFRQPARGDWPSVIDTVAARLQSGRD